MFTNINILQKDLLKQKCFKTYFEVFSKVLHTKIKCIIIFYWKIYSTIIFYWKSSWMGKVFSSLSTDNHWVATKHGLEAKINKIKLFYFNKILNDYFIKWSFAQNYSYSSSYDQSKPVECVHKYTHLCAIVNNQWEIFSEVRS